MDGVRYTKRAEAESMGDMYVNTRTEFIGDGAKWRMSVGAISLADREGGAIYKKCLGIQHHFAKQFMRAFDNVDCLITPTLYRQARRVEEAGNFKIDNFSRKFLVPANFTGIPAMSIPCGNVGGLPIGLQIMCGKQEDAKMFAIARFIEQHLSA